MAGDPGKGSNLTAVLLVGMEGELWPHPVLCSLHMCLSSPAVVPLEPRTGDLNFSHGSLQSCDKGMGLHCSPSSCTAFSLADRLLDSCRGANGKTQERRHHMLEIQYASRIHSVKLDGVSRLRVSSKLCVGWN